MQLLILLNAENRSVNSTRKRTNEQGFCRNKPVTHRKIFPSRSLSWRLKNGACPGVVRAEILNECLQKSHGRTWPQTTSNTNNKTEDMTTEHGERALSTGFSLFSSDISHCSQSKKKNMQECTGTL